MSIDSREKLHNVQSLDILSTNLGTAGSVVTGIGLFSMLTICFLGVLVGYCFSIFTGDSSVGAFNESIYRVEDLRC